MELQIQFQKDNFSPLVYFKGTEREIAEYEAFRKNALRKWESIIRDPHFRAAEIRKTQRGRHQVFHILAPSTRAAGFQLTTLDELGPMSHEDYSLDENSVNIEATYINNERREDNGFYGRPFSQLLEELYRLSKHGETVTVEVERRFK